MLTPERQSEHLAPEIAKIQAGVLLSAARLLARSFLDSLDVDLIFAHCCGLSRLEVMTCGDRVLSGQECERVREMLGRRKASEPVAYLLGEKEFYGLSFKVTKDVLIPRPDTELLVEEALKILNPPTPFPKGGQVKVIDVCTGSGCVAIAIAHSIKSAHIIATDLSEAALAVAQENANNLGVASQVEFRQGNLLEPCLAERDIDLIVANPPYIFPADMAALMADVRDYEPHLALEGLGADGLGHHYQIIDQARSLLKPGGILLMEIGAGQGEILASQRFAGFSAPEFLKDLGGIWRVVKYLRA